MIELIHHIRGEDTTLFRYSKHLPVFFEKTNPIRLPYRVLLSYIKMGPCPIHEVVLMAVSAAVIIEMAN